MRTCSISCDECFARLTCPASSWQDTYTYATDHTEPTQGPDTPTEPRTPLHRPQPAKRQGKGFNRPEPTPHHAPGPGVAPWEGCNAPDVQFFPPAPFLDVAYPEFSYGAFLAHYRKRGRID